MKRIVGPTLGLALCALATSAGAVTITDTTLFTATGTSDSSDLDGYGYGTVNRLDGLLDYVSWTHQFDFPSAVDAITSGVLSIDLSDDQDAGIEIAFGYAETGEWDFGLVSTQSYSYNIEVSSLADGLFSVTLASLWGDFFINQSVLEINYTPRTSVPEPATLSLLGAGLLGLALVRRRTKKAIA